MNIKQLILTKYRSVDVYRKETEVKLSRTYLYKLVNAKKPNPSLKAMLEIQRTLDVKLEEVIDALIDKGE